MTAEALDALKKIRKYEQHVNTQAIFNSPHLNPGDVVAWVIEVNRTRLTNTRPLELDDDEWAVE